MRIPVSFKFAQTPFCWDTSLLSKIRRVLPYSNLLAGLIGIPKHLDKSGFDKIVKSGKLLLTF